MLIWVSLFYFLLTTFLVKEWRQLKFRWQTWSAIKIQIYFIVRICITRIQLTLRPWFTLNVRIEHPCRSLDFFPFILHFFLTLLSHYWVVVAQRRPGFAVTRSEVPGFLIRQLRNYIRMPFLTITHRWEPRELAEAPCSRMPGRSWTYDLQAARLARNQLGHPPLLIE